MSTKPTLQELAIAWLERNGQRNVERSTSTQQAFEREKALHSTGTPERPAPVEKSRRVPLFRPLGLGTTEHSPSAAGDAEQRSEREAERWRYDFEERAAIREHDGGLPRAEAEAAALLDMATRWRSENPLPASDRAACSDCDKRQREALDAVTLMLMLNASKKDA
jgi:hypothetical protein